MEIQRKTLLNNCISYRQQKERIMKQKLIHFLKQLPFIRYIYENKLFIIFKALSKLPHKSNTIIFESFLGKQYSDNPRAIYKFIKDKHPDMNLYWSIDKKHIYKYKHLNLNILPRLSWKWLYMMATSKYWISNSRLPLWIPKPEHTVYIQTWHGTPLKKLGVDIKNVKMPGTTTEKYHKNFTYEANKWDFLISPNSFSTDTFKRAFQYNGKILETGYPRNDYLYTHNNDKEINKLKLKYKLPSDKKVILYAPTWRDNEYYDVGSYKFNLELDLKKMKAHISNDYIILFRLHYLVSDQLNLHGYEGFAYNFSSALDIQELYMVSDMLITDYSSVFFDYANLKRPILFFTYDLDDYRDKLRGFYINFEEEAPGPLIKTTENLINCINTINHNNIYAKKLEFFYNKYCTWESGKSSERVVKYIFECNN